MVQDALQAAGVDSDMAFAHGSRLHNCILGIVRLTPGTYYESSMTKFNSQERLLWQTLQYGDDAFSANARDACAIRDPVQAEFLHHEMDP